MAYRAAGLQVTEVTEKATLKHGRLLMQATIQVSKGIFERHTLGCPLPCPRPFSCQSACNQSVLYRDIVEHHHGESSVGQTRIITHPLGQLVCSIAVIIPCEERPWVRTS